MPDLWILGLGRAPAGAPEWDISVPNPTGVGHFGTTVGHFGTEVGHFGTTVGHFGTEWKITEGLDPSVCKACRPVDNFCP